MEQFDGGAGASFGSIFNSPEVFHPIDSEPLTAAGLVTENHSETANNNRQRNQEAVQLGNIDLTLPCDDSRLIIPNLIESLIFAAISAGGNREDFKQLINHKLRSIVNLAHYGLTREQSILPISKLKGCGGLSVKEMLELGLIENIPEGSAISFVNEDVDHSDPLVQTALASAKVAELNETGIPVAAAAQNHINGEIGILGVFLRRKGKIVPFFNPRLDPKLFEPENYDPEKIYENGIPFLDIDDLPSDCEPIYNYVMEQRAKMERMRNWYPNIEETQKVQNRVKAVLWTSSPRPPQLRFPNKFREPGSLFLVSQTRVKDVVFEGDYAAQRVHVPREAARKGLSQVHYPLGEAITHESKPDEAFHGMNTLIIERSDIETAIRDQGEFLLKPWAQEWMHLPGSQVITLATRGGIVREYGEYKLSGKVA